MGKDTGLPAGNRSVGRGGTASGAPLAVSGAPSVLAPGSVAAPAAGGVSGDDGEDAS